MNPVIQNLQRSQSLTVLPSFFFRGRLVSHVWVKLGDNPAEDIDGGDLDVGFAARKATFNHSESSLPQWTDIFVIHRQRRYGECSSPSCDLFRVTDLTIKEILDDVEWSEVTHVGAGVDCEFLDLRQNPFIESEGLVLLVADCFL